MKHVWVIMGNDYPEAVFDNEADAEKDVAARKKLDEISRQNMVGYSSKIYWRAYKFVLQSDLTL
jgi:hypothetical protein